MKTKSNNKEKKDAAQQAVSLKEAVTKERVARESRCQDKLKKILEEENCFIDVIGIFTRGGNTFQVVFRAKDE